MKLEKKHLYFGIMALILLFVISYWLLTRKSNVKNISLPVSPTEVVIPTVDNSVKVDLISLQVGKEVMLTIENIPPETQTIDYELSYQTAKQGFQGVIGTAEVKNKKSYQKKITLGTCSSGTCVYHEVMGKIKLTLKFNGGYGERIFEKEYEI
ncbi:MAG: hypothetical protein ACK4FL_01420 [Microgenomates group bacterium]